MMFRPSVLLIVAALLLSGCGDASGTSTGESGTDPASTAVAISQGSNTAASPPVGTDARARRAKARAKARKAQRHAAVRKRARARRAAAREKARAHARAQARAERSAAREQRAEQKAKDQAAAISDCDPNYTGACLDPNASDYDCEGGSGDGPKYTGPVTVVGDDHFGLDADGDGAGCEG